MAYVFVSSDFVLFKRASALDFIFTLKKAPFVFNTPIVERDVHITNHIKHSSKETT